MYMNLLPKEETSNVTVEEDFFGRIQRSHWGNCSVEPVRRFTIRNANKMSVQVTTYGATITSIRVPDRNGDIADVVLGFDNLNGYINHKHYFGATVGRVANRINNGMFKIHDCQYVLNRNEGTNHIHGGLKGFDKVIWESHVEGNIVTLSYLSPSWDEGYPGEVLAQVSYQVTDNNELVIEHKATASQPTPINLTNHSYFNLGGHRSGTIEEHVLSVNADRYTPVNSNKIPTGELMPVSNTEFDLRQPRRIGDILSSLNGGLDHNFCIRGEVGTKRLAARVVHPSSGRVMEVHTTQPGLQVYTGNCLPDNDTLLGKEHAIYRQHSALCLETQNYPNAVNQPNFPPCIVGPGNVYYQVTIYHFLTD